MLISISSYDIYALSYMVAVAIVLTAKISAEVLLLVKAKKKTKRWTWMGSAGL